MEWANDIEKDEENGKESGYGGLIREVGAWRHSSAREEMDHT